MAGSPCELLRRSATVDSAGRLVRCLSPRSLACRSGERAAVRFAVARTSVFDVGEGRPHIPSPLLLSARRTSWAYIKEEVLNSSARLVDAGRRGPGRCRTFPGHRGTGSSAHARRRGLGGGRARRRRDDHHPRTSTATRSCGRNRCQWTPTKRCRSRPVRSSPSSAEGGDRNGNRATDALHDRRKPS
jgi:hypothetical protein